MSCPAATVSIIDATSKVWDVAVIGAGPAGGLAARQLSREGTRVLLIDKGEFPRTKVCGCCLNKAALAVLASCGLDPSRLFPGAREIQALQMYSAGSKAQVRVPGGLAVSRATFDSALAQEAIGHGASFLPATEARVGPVTGNVRTLFLRSHDTTVEVHARAIICADGLPGMSLKGLPAFDVRVSPAARIGVGTIIENRWTHITPGFIYMSVGRGGYVGMVLLEEGSLNIAGALDSAYSRECGSPARACMQVMTEAGLPPIAIPDDAQWHGTLPLTRHRRRIADARIVVIGDAAGYVEPFTGEGITWALKSAQAASSIVVAGLDEWTDEIELRWVTAYRNLIGDRQTPVKIASAILRNPSLMHLTTRLLSHVPALAAPAVNYINRI